MADHRPLDRIRHLSPSDSAYALEALRHAWRGGALDDAAVWLDRLAPDDRAAWLADVRHRIDLGAWLGGLERPTALAWLHRFVPWSHVRVVQGATSQGRGGGVPLAEAVQWVRADHTLQLTEPCGLPWQLEWSPRAAQLWACECVERAIDHAERVLSLWEVAYPDDRRPREAISAARRAVEATRSGDADAAHDAARAARAAYGAAYAAADAAADAAYDAAYDAYAAARAAYGAAYAAADAADAAYGAAYAAAYAARAAARAAYGAAYDAADAADYAAAAARAASACAYDAEATERSARAARAAECEWQAERLWDYLCGVVAPPPESRL